MLNRNYLSTSVAVHLAQMSEAPSDVTSPFDHPHVHTNWDIVERYLVINNYYQQLPSVLTGGYLPGKNTLLTKLNLHL